MRMKRLGIMEGELFSGSATPSRLMLELKGD